MPSLRRTVSSPMVRASPYPTALSLSAAGALNTAIVTRSRRVGSGSDTSRRRVLADIEWWRVLDGQHSGDNELDQDQDEESQTGLGEARQDVEGAQLLTATMPVGETTVSDTDGALSLTAPFAALSISSIAPITPPRTRRETSDSSDSSVESTPESSPRFDAFHDTLFTTSLRHDCFCADPSLGLAPPPFLGSRPNTLNAVSMMRSVSFGGFASPREVEDNRFGDMIFL